MSHPLKVLLVLLLGVLVLPAHAEDPFAWLQPPPDEQLANDDTEIPVGKGAVFLPSLSSPSAEPPVILVGPDGNVRDVSTGERVIVDPGSYTVIVSPGSPGQGIGAAIEVREGETSLVPVTWGAIRILVTDERRVPFRGQYDLIAAEGRETMGTGFGADTFQGEQLMTWLVPPGVYRIVKPGANYRQLRNYATVYVPPGGLVRYRLVMDPDTNDFLGAGVLLPNEFGAEDRQDRAWRQMLIVGADGSFVQTQNVVGLTNQLVFSGNVFVDHTINFAKKGHHFTTLIQIEEGATWIRPQGASPLPIIKTRDRLGGNALYTWFARDHWGPYLRAGAETQAFATNVLSTEDRVYAITRTDDSVDLRAVPTNETLRTSDAWAPSTFREGGGLNYRALNNRWLTFNFRLGLGLRQNLFRGALILNDDQSTDEIEYREVASFNQAGAEGTIVFTARLPGWAVYTTNLELFAGFDAITQPSFEWRNTVTLRLTKFLSINYFANLDYLPLVVNNLQLDHSIVLRASWTIL